MKNKIKLLIIGAVLFVVGITSVFIVNASSASPSSASSKNLVFTNPTNGKSYYGKSFLPSYIYTEGITGQSQYSPSIVLDGFNSFDLSQNYGSTQIFNWYFELDNDIYQFGLAQTDPIIFNDVATLNCDFTFSNDGNHLIEYFEDVYLKYDTFYVYGEDLKSSSNNGSSILSSFLYPPYDVDVTYTGYVDCVDLTTNRYHTFDISHDVEVRGSDRVIDFIHTNLTDFYYIPDSSIIRVRDYSLTLTPTGDFIPGDSWSVDFVYPNADDYSPSIDLESTFIELSRQVNFEVGSYLFSSINEFLKFELVPGFSLMSLFILIIAIPLLISVLKMFLGG